MGPPLAHVVPRLAEMKPALLLLSLVLLLGGCAPRRLSSIVRQAASVQPGYCGGEITVQRLNGWGFRVQSCEQTTFYHCYVKRYSGGRTGCCEPVADEGTASAVFFAPRSSEVTCNSLSVD